MQKNSADSSEQLSVVAKKIREDILSMSYTAKSAHVGGALSVVEILVALYFSVMKNDPEHPDAPFRDRMVFSKAHDAKALFAVLCERGYFPKSVLLGYEQNDGMLPGHSTRHCVPGIEVSAGALGHGLPIAAGLALAGKMGRKKHKIFAVLSDGECDEGSTWEAALFAGHHGLENLIAIVDYNKLQGYGYTKDVLELEPFADKFRSFGWGVREVDGHSIPDLISILHTTPFNQGKPSLLIAHTIKGLGGVKRHINQISSQYIPPTKEEFEALMEEKK